MKVSICVMSRSIGDNTLDECTLAKSGELPSAENMQVNVEYGLTTLLIAIDHQAVAGLVNAIVFCNPCGHQQHVAQHFLIFFTGIINGVDMLVRNYQDMNRGLRVNITKCQDLVVFVDDISWYVFADNFAKETVITHCRTAVAKLRCWTGEVTGSSFQYIGGEAFLIQNVCTQFSALSTFVSHHIDTFSLQLGQVFAQEKEWDV